MNTLWKILFFSTVQLLTAEFTYRSYQQSIQCKTQYSPRYPRLLSEIQEIVNYAISQNIKVKAIGSKHSISDSICTTGIPIFMLHINHFAYNPDTQTATAGAGMQLLDFYEKLHQLGRAIYSGPKYGGITIGGAIANGAHGTGLKYHSSVSEQLVSVTFVDGQGKVRKVRKNEDHFKALMVNLGLLGIIYEVELETVPQYKLHIRHFPMNDKILQNGSQIVSMAQKNDYFQFWWFPANRQVVMGVGSRIPVNYTGNCRATFIKDAPKFSRESMSMAMEYLQRNRQYTALFLVQSLFKLTLYEDLKVTTPVFVEEDGVSSCLDLGNGYGHRMVASRCNPCAWDDGFIATPFNFDNAEIVVPLSEFIPAIQTLKQICSENLMLTPIGIHARFLKNGESYMSTFEGDEPWVSLEWATFQRWDKLHSKLGLATFQLISQILVEKHGGRPHWAKNGLYYSSSEIIRKAHPKVDKFIEAMNEFDPEELFLNTFGERIKYGMDVFTVWPDLVKHCAVNDACICRTNYDCGDGDYILRGFKCDEISGYPKYNVCLPGITEQIRQASAHRVIQTIAAFDYDERRIVDFLGKYSVFENVLGNKRMIMF